MESSEKKLKTEYTKNNPKTENCISGSFDIKKKMQNTKKLNVKHIN